MTGKRDNKRTKFKIVSAVQKETPQVHDLKIGFFLKWALALIQIFNNAKNNLRIPYKNSKSESILTWAIYEAMLHHVDVTHIINASLQSSES